MLIEHRTEHYPRYAYDVFIFKIFLHVFVFHTCTYKTDSIGVAKSETSPLLRQNDETVGKILPLLYSTCNDIIYDNILIT